MKHVARLLCLLAIVSIVPGALAGEGAPDPAKAVALIIPTNYATAHGTVTFTETADGVLIEARVAGLIEGEHGFHIHEFGDITADDGKSAGGHFNPEGHVHAAPDAQQRHAGDLGNLVADERGFAEYRRLDKHLTLTGANSIIGRAVVIHAKGDDLTSQPSGAAGDRIGLGVIGIAGK